MVDFLSHLLLHLRNMAGILNYCILLKYIKPDFIKNNMIAVCSVICGLLSDLCVRRRFYLFIVFFSPIFSFFFVIFFAKLAASVLLVLIGC